MYKPVRSLLGDRVWRLIPELTQTEQMPPSDLAARKARLLRELLERAYAGSGFFRERLAAAGFRPGHGFDPVSYSRIPELTKADIRDYMHAGDRVPSKGAIRSTSGSSGEPLVFAKDRLAANYMDAAMHQVYGWYGIGIGDREGRFWGRALHRSARVRQGVRDLLLNRRRMSAFDISDDGCERFWKKLQRFRPQYIYCYPNAAYEFAAYLQKTGRTGHELGLKAIICTGEVLLPNHEAVLSNVFRCPLVNEYGSTENGIIAFRCPAGSMHVLEQNVHVEIVADDGTPVESGAVGRILVSELHSTDVPFVRYALGDLGAISREPCDCGRTYPVMSVQSGRVDSFIITAAGKKVYDAILAYTFKQAFRKFFGRQVSIHRLEIDYIPADGFDENQLDQLRQTLHYYLGTEMHIRFRRVDSIPVDSSGKARYFVSEVVDSVGRF